MTAAQWLVAVVTALYIGASIAYGFQGQWKECWLFSGYSIANMAFLIWR